MERFPGAAGGVVVARRQINMTLPRLDASTPGSGNGTGADQAYARLRDAILHGQLTPGRAVSQVRLGLELGVSRPRLREAVRMLQREGLISGEANRMVRVADSSIEDSRSSMRRGLPTRRSRSG